MTCPADAAGQAAAANATVAAFLHDRHRPAEATASDGRSPTPLDRATGGTSTDWLHHRLTVTGPAEAVAAFQQAAAGAGTIPWQLDLARLEEDWFLRLVDPARRTLSLEGARLLAGQLRDAVGCRHTVAVGRVGRTRACALDLHALVPVPPGILALGPDHPEALVWLWQHWGTTEALRRVGVDVAEARHARDHPGPGWRLEFWSADWTPWQAVARLRQDWPALTLDVRPSYG